MAYDFLLPPQTQNPFSTAKKMDWSGSTPPPTALKNLGVSPNAPPSVMGVPIVPSLQTPTKTTTAPSAFDMTGAIAGGVLGGIPTPAGIAPPNGATPPITAAPTSDPNGFAIIDGKRVNYADIGKGKVRQGFMFATGAVPDANVGIAAQDAQQKQDMMNALGVGVGTGGPRTTNEILGTQGTHGFWGSIAQTNYAARQAAEDKARYDTGIAQDLAAQKLELDARNADTEAAYKQGFIQNMTARTALDQQMTPTEVGMKNALTNYYTSHAKSLDAAAQTKTPRDYEAELRTKYMGEFLKDPSITPEEAKRRVDAMLYSSNPRMQYVETAPAETNWRGKETKPAVKEWRMSPEGTGWQWNPKAKRWERPSSTPGKIETPD